jgi:hypothetical protein
LLICLHNGKYQLLANHLEPLTEQQMLGLTNLQQSSQQAEDALSQGMEALQQSLAETLAGSLGPAGSSGNVANYMGQMAMAMGKLGTLENFLRQVSIYFVSLWGGTVYLVLLHKFRIVIMFYLYAGRQPATADVASNATYPNDPTGFSCSSCNPRLFFTIARFKFSVAC